MNKLQVLEINEFEKVQEEMREGFRVEDKGQVEWCLRKVQALQAEIKDNNTLADQEIMRINKWREDENKKAEDSINFFKGLLEEYMRSVNAEDEKVRSMKLPHGIIRLKKQQPEFKFHEEKTIAWLKENYPDKIKIVEKFSKTDVKKIVKDTGEVFDGLEIVQRDYKFEMEV
ncbi:MAG: host-nuclease inhibitor Gam family protein [Anaeromicrobium sp.]|jgi:hypothetical protein|uniref:host-nuclease inhibitor Gam family protein n=1 Tax=Anaeromicrobium sp. TaxID=1929132 RepID=UPI0025EE55EE|nr:host-nuclease inhibitor Gam family protein [Anaeromicrobium sp.]MCT4593145.1 host-nuclease inhibitor Gam family protein [Anaeromicrobium sp.]